MKKSQLPDRSKIACPNAIETAIGIVTLKQRSIVKQRSNDSWKGGQMKVKLHWHSAQTTLKQRSGDPQTTLPQLLNSPQTTPKQRSNEPQTHWNNQRNQHILTIILKRRSDIAQQALTRPLYTLRPSPCPAHPDSRSGYRSACLRPWP